MHLDPHRLDLLRHFRLDRTYVEGEGAWLVDDAGRRVLDLSSQYGAVPLGHNPPQLWAALWAVRQAALPALVQPSRPIQAEALARRLAHLAPVGADPETNVVTFAQSGAEAVEIAIRLARTATGRPLIAGAERGYHGKTLGARALTWKSRDLDPETAPPGFTHIPFNDPLALDALFANHGSTLAALVLEPVQGEGGVREADLLWLKQARALCDRHGTLLVLDEIQTGLGRTGPLFCADAYGVRADVVLLSKALGGGLVPLSACISAGGLLTPELALDHGSTFANNNLTCSVGLALLDALTEHEGRLLKRVERTGAALGERLRSLSARYPGVVKAVRGRGLLWGIELEAIGADSSFMVATLCGADALTAVAASFLLNVHDVRVIPCLNGGRVIPIQPPLDVSEAELERGLCALEDLLQTIHLQDWSRLLRPVITDAADLDGARDCRPLVRPVQSSVPASPRETPTRFAFLIHHTSPDDLVRTSPALRHLSRDDLRQFYDWAGSRALHAPICFMPSVRGTTSGLAQGWLIALSHTPEVLAERTRSEVSRDVARAVDTARRLGAQVVGLGAFTSIVTRNGRDLRDFPGALTTGSALTVAMAVDALHLAASRVGRDLSRCQGLVLGTGAVGGAAAVLAAEEIPSLWLVGNPARPRPARTRVLIDRIYAKCAHDLLYPDARGVARALRQLLPAAWRLGERGHRLVDRLMLCSEGRDPEGIGLAREIAWASGATGRRPPVSACLDLDSALALSDVVIASSSAPEPLIHPHALKPGAIVCDVAKPADVSEAVLRERPDVLVFDGGLVGYPEPISFGQNIGHEPGVNLACLSETVVLALEGHTQGRFGVDRRALVEEVATIRAAAHRHGFRVAELRRDGRVLGEADLTRTREIPTIHQAVDAA